MIAGVALTAAAWMVAVPVIQLSEIVGQFAAAPRS